MSNNYISYLNSLHNLGAGGANALAESQALNEYFTGLYEPFPIVDPLLKSLRNDQDKVIILTGHAGDGKSTVALDIYKNLSGLSASEPLSNPLKKLEVIESANVSIVKDMSELSTEDRQNWLTKAFQEDGSWLIVSNTGPLLQSLLKYSEGHSQSHQIESDILESLSQDVNPSDLSEHTIKYFEKDLIILNLTRLDNVRLGAKLLNKITSHSGWSKCEECSESKSCPIKRNQSALVSAGETPEQRVRWVYQRLNAYEHRLTLRQIVAHIALGITAGMSCEQAKAGIGDTDSSGLEKVLFSESFFGYKNGKVWPEAQNLHAIALLHRELFGSPAGVEYDRLITTDAGMGWAEIPEELRNLERLWQQTSSASSGLRWRYALRRLCYLFGTTKQSETRKASLFLDNFLISEELRDFDEWQNAKKLTLSSKESRALEKSCLSVLLEVFSGFSVGQFKDHDKIYLTLRRSDKAVIQPTQLIIKTLPFRDFRLQYCSRRSMPILSYDRDKAILPLSLPLLDYIKQRSSGELGTELSPIYQSQLDAFQSALIRAGKSDSYDDEIELLQTGVDGVVHLHRFVLDAENNSLEKL
ncbi:hypothetical protein [Endozoicomonas sp. ISHI1]|uniref:hypothetical protein n=1 Tax=Endozoicomonas sp. ISHI1 TaxID=2825882 RepID=UPI0021487964|nr:hypothetical protein [Endozoicomonas sp. ISHI1]